MRQELEPALRAGVLTRSAGRLQFAHALLSEALLANMPSHVCEGHHLTAQHALSTAADSCEQPDSVPFARHAYLAGDTLAAATRRQLCERAGRQATWC